MKLKSLTLALISAGVVAAGSAGAVGWNPSEWFAKSESTAVQPQSASRPTQVAAAAPPVAAPIAATSAPAAIPQISVPNYRAIVQQYASAVVGVNVDGVMKTSMRGDDSQDGVPDGMPDEFQRFFRGFPGFGQGSRGQFRIPRGDVPTHGMGSGFIVRSDGVILTNAHVVRDAQEVTVKLSDRREFKAKVLGSDAMTDVAVLKIDAQNLPVVRLGSPSRLEVGDYVLAIGSPFGFEASATSGIVSAKGRALPGDGYVPFIQTDAAVNPGNSGGPLFDAGGEVVGINSQIYSQSGGYQGISFAIPIDVAMKVEDQIVSTGKVQHARLGVTVQQLDQSLAESFKLTAPDGALVSSVLPNSAAAKAGIEPGDVILKYNGQPIARSTDLPSLVGMSKAGDKATIEVWRSGKRVDLSATLAEATDVANADSAGPANAPQGKLGVVVRPLSEDEKQESGLASGVVVEQCGGNAARAGIRPGDVILSVNGKTVKGINDLRDIVSKSDKQMALLVQRGDAKIFVPVKVG